MWVAHCRADGTVWIFKSEAVEVLQSFSGANSKHIRWISEVDHQSNVLSSPSLPLTEVSKSLSVFILGFLATKRKVLPHLLEEECEFSETEPVGLTVQPVKPVWLSALTRVQSQ